MLATDDVSRGFIRQSVGCPAAQSFYLDVNVFSVMYTVGPYVVDTIREAVAGAGLGVVLLLLVSLHVLNDVARFGGFLTDAQDTVRLESETATYVST